VDSAFGERGRVKVQAVTLAPDLLSKSCVWCSAGERDVVRQFGKNGASAAAHFEHAARSIQFCFIEEISSQVASPFRLLGVACVPVHFFYKSLGNSEGVEFL